MIMGDKPAHAMFNIRGWRGVALPPLRPPPKKRSALRTRFAGCRRPPCRARRWPSSPRGGGSAVPLGSIRRRAWTLRSSAALAAALMAFPQGIAGMGATRGGGWGCAHPHRPRCPHRASKPTGRSHPRPDGPDRHRRFGGRGATSGRPATCGTGEVRIARADCVHTDTDVTCTPLVRHRELDCGRDPLPALRAKRSSGRTVTPAATASAGLLLSAALRYREGSFSS